MPRKLTNNQKRTQLDISRYLLSRYEDDPNDFMEQVVTQDLTWIHHFHPESKIPSKQWKYPGSPPPKRFHLAGKMMASIFLDSQGEILIGYHEQGRTIIRAYYAGELRQLHQEIAKKR